MQDACRQSADYIAGHLPMIPQTALVLGSGMQEFRKEIAIEALIDYNDILCFPKPSTPSHRGELILGRLRELPVLLLCGRSHYYENYSMGEISDYVPVLHLLGIRNLILTNAAGAINTGYHVGDLVLVRDHIKFFDESPLRDMQAANTADKFVDMSRAYSERLLALCHQAGCAAHLPLWEGVYAYMSGPQYETPAEIRALRVLGADLVGMSTVPEVIRAAYCELEVLCISHVTNMAAGIEKTRLSHTAVVQRAKENENLFYRLFSELLPLLAEERSK